MRGHFVGDVTTTSVLELSLENSARVSLRSRRVPPLATVGPRACAEVDAFAATPWPTPGRVTLADRPLPHSLPLRRPRRSTTATISFAGFFFALVSRAA